MINNPLPFITLLLLFTFDVFGAVKVSVNEMQSVTLNTGDTEIPRDDLILWTFGAEAILIAERNETMVLLHERFVNRLQLNDQNGDLTIRNMTYEHSGLYQVKIIGKRATIYKRFRVTVISITQPSTFMSTFLIGLLVLICFLYMIC